MRVLIFLLTNLAVLVVVAVVGSLLGIDRYLIETQGFSPQELLGMLVMCSLFGFGGSLISLMMSRFMAVRATGARVIEDPANQVERLLVSEVRQLSQAAELPMPQVAIYPSEQINAFATGASRRSSLVAVSTGLLNQMDRRELRGVLAHEVSHIANGDMVTMSLLQGVLNTFVYFISFVIARILESRFRMGFFGYYMVVTVLQMVFGILATMIAMAFSRHREFRADAGGAKLGGREQMIAALRRLQRTSETKDSLPDEVAAFGISGGVAGLLRSHPPLEERIKALESSY
ncbi:MAG: protease HtpX [Gammaproteobacteria bacterium AqS3]|nr:protease HtpX [Gammaproteobacteria bacterium AqS3]